MDELSRYTVKDMPPVACTEGGPLCCIEPGVAGRRIGNTFYLPSREEEPCISAVAHEWLHARIGDSKHTRKEWLCQFAGHRNENNVALVEKANAAGLCGDAFKKLFFGQSVANMKWPNTRTALQRTTKHTPQQWCEHDMPP